MKVYEKVIEKHLNEELPFMATENIMMRAVKKGGDRAVVEGNRIVGNLYGVDVHGGQDVTVRGNLIEGRRDRRMNDRGNGVYVWTSPGLVVDGNVIDWGRDGIASRIKWDPLQQRFMDFLALGQPGEMLSIWTPTDGKSARAQHFARILLQEECA